MTTLSTRAADAQSRIDDGRPLPGDHDCAERLEQLLQESAERILAREIELERLRYEAQHADHDESEED